MLILDGKAVAEARKAQLKPKVTAFINHWGRSPHLVVVLVGDDPASQVYVRNKLKSCESIGIRSSQRLFPSTATEVEIKQVIQQLNTDNDVDGVLVQLPLPPGINPDLINEGLNPLKDVDGLTYYAMGYLAAGKPLVAPCTPQGVMNLFQHYKIPVAGANIAVIGRSQIVGRPMAALLTNADATVTLCHSRTRDLRWHSTHADIVIVAAGKKAFFGKEYFKKGAVVIDVGIHGSGTGKGICGDVKFDELQDWASAVTPVPGGVGPLTIATLLENTLHLAELRSGHRPD